MASADKEQLGADLSAYLDGELEPQRAAEIEHILAESEEARRMLADLHTVSESLGTLPRMKAPVDFARQAAKSSERQALLERPVRSSGAVWRIVWRISGSAAVIFACAFAGWMVLHGPTSDSTPAADQAEFAKAPPNGTAGAATPNTLAEMPARDADAAAPAVAMAGSKAERLAAQPDAKMDRLRALGYADNSNLAEPTDALALDTSNTDIASKPYAAEPEAWVAAQPTSIDSDTPAVEITVSPQSEKEYVSSMETLERWQRLSQTQGVIINRGGRGGLAGSEDMSALTENNWRANETLITQNVVIDLPPEKMQALLVDLEAQAPQNVQVAMTFRPQSFPQVQQIMAQNSLPVSNDWVEEAEPQEMPAPSLAWGGRMAPATPSGAVAEESKPEAEVRSAGRGATARREITEGELKDDRVYAYAARRAHGVTEDQDKSTEKENAAYDAARQPTIGDVSLGLPCETPPPTTQEAERDPLVVAIDNLVYNFETQVQNVFYVLNSQVQSAPPASDAESAEEPLPQMRLQVNVLAPTAFENSAPPTDQPTN